MARQTFDAQASGYLNQISAGQPADLKAQMSEYVLSVMGWAAYKDSYTELVKSTYTQKELQAAIAFMKSPLGRTVTKKGIKLSGELAVRMAKKQQKTVVGQSSHSSRESTSDGVEVSLKDLKTSDVTEHNQEGKIYFTGSIENTGKDNARGVQIEVNLFDGERFVDQYSTVISGYVPAGGKRYFKVSCGCKDAPPAKHDAFKVAIVPWY